MRTRDLTVAVALLVTLTVITALAIVSRADADPVTGTFTIRASSAQYTPERCPVAQRAISFYRQKYAGHRAPMGLPGPVPRRWYPCDAARRRATEWRDRARAAHDALTEWNSTIGQVVRRLDRGLAGTPMSGTGRELEQAGREYGIHPAFIAAIAGTESSFGAASCSSNRFNAYGLANCTGIWHVPDFRSWSDSYRFMAKFLAQRWPSATTTHHYYGYAACSDCWGRKTAFWMRERFGLGPGTRY